MTAVLVIFFLTVRTSYLDDIEVEATDDSFDTVQFYATDSGAWRIKTFAIDQDVHVWKIDATVSDIVALARHNTEKHYSDVLSEGYIIEALGGVEEVRRELTERGLSDNLEMSNEGFLFWCPEGSEYHTRSAPITTRGEVQEHEDQRLSRDGFERHRDGWRSPCNNIAFCGLDCGHSSLAVALENQRGSGEDDSAAC